MIVDYRIYMTIYALSFALHLASFALIKWKAGRYFWPVEATALATAGVVGLVNFLDWLWS